jgi:hypothetical protein
VFFSHGFLLIYFLYRGQGGVGHINCRPKIDWIKRFHKLGWVIDYDLTTHFINYMVSCYHFGWLRMNVIILIKG